MKEELHTPGLFNGSNNTEVLEASPRSLTSDELREVRQKYPKIGPTALERIMATPDENGNVIFTIDGQNLDEYDKEMEELFKNEHKDTNWYQ